MLKLWMIQAEHGDCFLLDYGTRKDPHYMLIDGGPRQAYSAHLRTQLDRITQSGGILDQVVLSHIDDDHAHGLLDFMHELQEQRNAGGAALVEVEELWHNTFSQALGDEVTGRFRGLVQQQADISAGRDLPSEQESFLLEVGGRDIAQGDRLTRDAEALEIPINPGFNAADGMICADETVQAVPLVNLRVYILGPLRKNLKRLEREWKAWLKKQETQLGQGIAGWALDTAYPNLSSLMFLVEGDGKTILFTGDERGDHILQGLKTAGLLGKGKGAKLHVDVLKVPHHGSARNTTREFFQIITADRYVISANGKYGNPDLTTLAWIVETAKEDGREIEIWISNETDLTDEFRKRYDPAAYRYQWKVLQPGEHALELDLAPSGRTRRRPAAARPPTRIDSVMGRPVVGGQKAVVDSVEGRPVVGGQRASVVDTATGRPVIGGQSVQVEKETETGSPAAATTSILTGEASTAIPETTVEPKIQVLTPTPGRAPASKRALLVGINTFPTLSPGDTLRGCINDTQDIQASLTQFFGFLPEEIRILRDSQATTLGIKDGLDWLLSDYGGSDVRLFHISSHGTQVADQNNDEYECKDEVIVTYDHSWSRPFRDDHLFEIFDKIPQGVNFTFIADSCHSGTIQKGLLDRSIDFKPRYVVPPAEVEDAIYDLRQKRDQATQQYIAGKIIEDSRGRNLTQEEVMALIGKYQKTFQENTYKNVIATDRHVLLAGCEDKQISADARIDGVYRGAFSWAIGKSIRETNGSQTYAELLQQVMGYLRQDFSQIPQLECPGDYKNVRLFSPVA